MFFGLLFIFHWELLLTFYNQETYDASGRDEYQHSDNEDLFDEEMNSPTTTRARRYDESSLPQFLSSGQKV